MERWVLLQQQKEQESNGREAEEAGECNNKLISTIKDEASSSSIGAREGEKGREHTESKRKGSNGKKASVH